MLFQVFNGQLRGLGEQSKRTGYVKLSFDLRRYLHFFKGARLNLMIALVLHSDEDGWSHPATKLLRRETGYNPDTIFKTLAELCKLRVHCDASCCQPGDKGEGHRVLLRKKTRKAAGRFANNYYLIFPTTEEIEKYETPYLFPSGPEEGDNETTTISSATITDFSDTVKTRDGKSPTRKNTDTEKDGVGENPSRENSVSEKDHVGESPIRPIKDLEQQPDLKLDPEPSAEGLENKTISTHTPEPPAPDATANQNESSVCVEITEEDLRQYAEAHGLGVGWITTAKRTGEWNDDIVMFLRRRDAEARAVLDERKTAPTSERQRAEPVRAFVIRGEAVTFARPEIIDSIREHVGPQAFDTWFAPLEFRDGPDRITAFTSSQIVMDWIRGHYREIVEEAAAKMSARVEWTE